MNNLRTSRRLAHGFVLITAMIFLLVLTLVAVIAVRSSGLELRMSANDVMHTEAFEASESPRLVIGRLIDRLGFYAETGWPVAIGGLTPDAVFAYTIPTRIDILDSTGTSTGAPLNWFTDITEGDFGYTDFQSRASYDVANVAPSGSEALPLTAMLDVKRARTAPKSGCDLGSGGYEGISGRSCADYIFLLTSRGTAAGGIAEYETSSMYRYVPR